jgi:hypothetical protein
VIEGEIALGFLLRREVREMVTGEPMVRNLSGYVAAKAIAISVVAIGAAVVLSQMALPRLTTVLGEMGAKPPDWALTALEYQSELPLLPVPGLLLGIAAFMFKPMRGMLAWAAMLASVAATGIIVAMLIGSLVPFYNMAELLQN